MSVAYTGRQPLLCRAAAVEPASSIQKLSDLQIKSVINTQVGKEKEKERGGRQVSRKQGGGVMVK